MFNTSFWLLNNLFKLWRVFCSPKNGVKCINKSFMIYKQYFTIKIVIKQDLGMQFYLIKFSWHTKFWFQILTNCLTWDSTKYTHLKFRPLSKWSRMKRRPKNDVKLRLQLFFDIIAMMFLIWISLHGFLLFQFLVNLPSFGVFDIFKNIVYRLKVPKGKALKCQT